MNGAYGVSIAGGEDESGTPELLVEGEGDFGEVLTNAGDSVRSLTLSNEGTAALEIERAVIAGDDARQFRITVQPSDTIEAGGWTTVEITYDPGSAGEHNAFLLLESNDPNGPIQLPLQGTGLQPEINADDHGDSIETATQLDRMANGFISLDGDMDVFTFTVDSSSKVTIRTRGDTDTYGILMDEEGEVLAEDDDRGTGFNFRIRQRLNPGTYHILVEGYDQDTSG
ncbi:MAG: choice-of-anchor D domain-containing protein, partial [Verrucomicrobiota bacterium]